MNESCEPIQFGYQPDRTYLPSPREIREACELLQADWDESERRSRAPWAYSQRVIAVKQFDSDSIALPDI